MVSKRLAQTGLESLENEKALIAAVMQRLNMGTDEHELAEKLKESRKLLLVGGSGKKQL